MARTFHVTPFSFMEWITEGRGPRTECNPDGEKKKLEQKGL